MSQIRAAVQPMTLGRYNLIERLGRGGQGEVWRAHDGSRGIDVALKILAPALARSAAAWAALQREHALSARLQHPAVLQVQPPERLDGYAVLPMELAIGGDLSRLCGEGYLVIVPVLLEVAEALEYAHAHGVVHRDLKPGNVLFDSRGRVKLADFGVAALLPGAVADPLEARTQGLSPFTASPEQLRGEPPSPADDIYGFGALAYELLAGHPPHFPRFDAVRARAGAVARLVPTRQTPEELIGLVMGMLAKSAGERPTSMRQVIEELEATLNSTLCLDPADLADLLGPAAPPGPGSARTAASPEPSGAGQVSATACAASTSGLEEHALRGLPASLPSSSDRSQEAPPSSSDGAQRVPPAPAPISAVLEPVLAGGTVSLGNDAIPLLGPMHQAPRRPHTSAAYSRRKPHRLRYVLFGLVWGTVIAAGALRWISREDLHRDLQRLSTLVSQARGGGSADSARAAGAAGAGSAARTPPAASADAASGSSVAAQRTDFNRRLSALAARGAATWDAADFAAARTEAAEANGAGEAGGIAVARRHWRKAAELLSAMQGKASRELASTLESGRAALAAGHPQSAARAFHFALRIDPGSRQAVEGARQARRLAGVLPVLADAHTAEHAREYRRAAHDFSLVLARDPGYAPAKAGLARINRTVKAAFADSGYARALAAGLRAFGNGHLFQAQADFQQALVYRPRGLEAARGLDQVNAALRERYSRP